MEPTTLAKYFPEGYWEEFARVWGHNFFEVHVWRTIEYYKKFIKDMGGKTVLEIGGFPGLLLSAYLEAGAKPTSLDSPEYRPDWFVKWLRERDIMSFTHDIVKGYPSFLKGLRYDYAVISDVLMHIEGYPEEFLAGLATNADKIIFLSYSSNEGPKPKAISHSLFTSWPHTGQDEIVKHMTSCGCKLIENAFVTEANRHIVILEGA